MEVIHQTKTLKAALQRLKTVPGVLKTVLGSHALKIEANIEGINYSRATSEARLSLQAEGEVNEDGEAVVNFQDFFDLVGRLTGDGVNLTRKGQRLEIVSGKSKGSIQVWSEYEKPGELSLEGGKEINLAYEDLEPHLKGALSHTSKLEADKTLMGIHILGRDNKLYLCGCDRKRLYLGVMENGGLPDINLVLPPEAAASILSALADFRGKVKLTHNAQMIAFEADNLMALFTLLAGEYPNYQVMIDGAEKRETVNQVKINREGFLGMIQNVSAFGSDDSYRAIILEPRDGFLKVSSGANGTHLEEDLDATCKEGPPIKFNSRYLKDALASLRLGAVEVRQIDQGIILQEGDRKVILSAMDIRS